MESTSFSLNLQFWRLCDALFKAIIFGFVNRPSVLEPQSVGNQLCFCRHMNRMSMNTHSVGLYGRAILTPRSMARTFRIAVPSGPVA
jgi:hypothetical protein